MYLIPYFLFFLPLIVQIKVKMKRSKKSLGARLNNPFNIRYSSHNNWLGQICNVNGFVKFSLPYYGVRAFALLFRTYLRTGRDTISRFIRSYAPSVENNTDHYIRFVCGYMGCNPHYKLSLNDFRLFARAVCSVEIGSDSLNFFNEIDSFDF